MAWIVIATRRGRPRKRWMPLAIGVLMHLFLDAMWASPDTLWWPFFGFDFSTAEPATAGAYLADVLAKPLPWLGEVAGLTYLLMLARRAGLGSAPARRTLLESGRIDAPIGFGGRQGSTP